ncbi:MAG: hypothetical protein E6L04_01640 [Thaumarchaeota archaeon]|nr:MAG: hypothetical protein E6K97_10765 [Nitrososphaerota archaeon]TLX88019.1 MAG: hypothetical protein E6L04_01640 [Nitrososphaerota archaeon]
MSSEDNEIKTRREYIQSLISSLGSDQINRENLISEMLEEFNKLYVIIETLNSEISQVRELYNFVINLIISIPEVQNNPSLMAKIQEFYPEESARGHES